MKTAIIGSRTATATSYELLKQTAEEMGTTEIISGGAQGADKLAERYARETGKPLTIHLPEWDKYGAAAGPIRNQKIIADSQQLIAIWDGKSKGTADSVKKAKRLGKRVRVIWI